MTYDDVPTARLQIGENIMMVWRADDREMVNIRGAYDDSSDGYDVKIDQLIMQIEWLKEIIEAQPDTEEGEQ